MGLFQLRDIGGIPESLRDFLERFVYAVGDGTPTDLVTGRNLAAPGTIYINRSTGIAYWNTGTLAAPTWTATSTLSAGFIAADATGRGYMATDLFNVATVDAKIAAGAIGEDRLTANELTGRVVGNLADNAVIGGVPVIHMVALTSGANGDTDVTLTHKTRVLDAWVIMKGAGTAGCTVTVKNGATAITDAINVAAAGDRDIVRAGEVDDAQYAISGSGTLRVSKASSGADFPGALVVVTGVRVA